MKKRAHRQRIVLGPNRGRDKKRMKVGDQVRQREKVERNRKETQNGREKNKYNRKTLKTKKETRKGRAGQRKEDHAE